MKPDLVQLLKNELAKKWAFYKQSYCRHDLNKICEVEELITEWFDLSIEPEKELDR